MFQEVYTDVYLLAAEKQKWSHHINIGDLKVEQVKQISAAYVQDLLITSKYVRVSVFKMIESSICFIEP